MAVQLAWGRQQLELDLPEQHLVQPFRSVPPAALADPVQALQGALAHPIDYPPLWRALTPDDQVAIVVDERIPGLARLLVALFEHLQQAHVRPEAITLICLPPSSGQVWLDDLPDAFQDVHIEVHQPGDRKRLAYLATTKQGRRVYLNRTAVDADQLVLLTRRGFDSVVGHSGAETTFFPGLGDEATIAELGREPRAHDSSDELWPIEREAREIAWLLGAPFFVQTIDGPADSIAAILAGPLESSDAGIRALNERWRLTIDSPVDVVIATITGDPLAQTIDDLARAYFAASRVVRPGGSIALLTEAAPTLGPSLGLSRHHDDPALALRVLLQEKPSDLATAFLWATAASQARLYLLSGLANDVAEELFTIPMQSAAQVRNLITEPKTWLILPDAHKTLTAAR